jgi:molybdate transport system substrate-binding protein
MLCRLVRLVRLAGALACAMALPCFGDELIVSAAASLTDAFKDIGEAFEVQHPGTSVNLKFDASGTLLQDIAKGEPADVFASADQETMEQAVAMDLIKVDAWRHFARNSLVVVVPAGAAYTPASLRDLLDRRVTGIAIGVPTLVPAGRHTRAVLEKANLWPRIEAKMILAADVRKALDYVARRDADAAFVYATDAALMPREVKVAFTVPTERPVLYAIAPIATSRQAASAGKFVAFVQSLQAQAILAKYGFAKP